MENVWTREILPQDNEEIAKVIREVLVELGVPKVGTAYADKVLDNLYEAYNLPKATYFVVGEGTKIIGGAGVAQLDNYAGNVCELQKMYVLHKARGRGIGTKMMEICLEKARAFGFDQC